MDKNSHRSLTRSEINKRSYYRHHKKNKERIKIYNKIFPEVRRRSSLKNKFNMTLQEYEDLWIWQGGVCGICFQPEKQRKELAVDHCHKTGEIRGLLCSMCNTAIGKLNDDPILLRRALQYIERKNF